MSNPQHPGGFNAGGQYGQPYGNPGQYYTQPGRYGVQPPRKKSRLLQVGVILVIVAVLLAPAAFLFGVFGSVPKPDELHKIGSSTTFAVEDGKTMGIWAEVGTGASCRVLDSEGEPIDITPRSSQNFENSAGAYELIGEVRDAGDYTAECRSGSGAVGPTVKLGQFIGSIFVFILSIFVGVAGAICIVVGLITRKRH